MSVFMLVFRWMIGPKPSIFSAEDGYPAMMELADGTKVARGDKDWQYWKFAWRRLGRESTKISKPGNSDGVFMSLSKVGIS